MSKEEKRKKEERTRAETSKVEARGNGKKSLVQR